MRIILGVGMRYMESFEVWSISSSHGLEANLDLYEGSDKPSHFQVRYKKNINVLSTLEKTENLNLSKNKIKITCIKKYSRCALCPVSY